MFTRPTRFAATCVLTGAPLLVAAHANAAVVYVDFGTVGERHSVGAADTNGNRWNYVTGATDALDDLLADDGTATTLDLDMTNFTGPGSFNGALTPSSALNGGRFAFQAVTNDAVFFTSSLSPTITLSDLDATKTYDLVFYGSRVTSSARSTTFAVGTDAVTLQTSGSSLTDNWNGDTVVSLSNLTPIANQIVIDLSADDASGFGYINAMQITTVPEPATLALSGLGSLILLRRQR